MSDRWRRLEVPRAAGVSRAAFAEHWFGPGLPVVLDDLQVGPAAAWTPERLVALLGQTPVEAMQGWAQPPARNTYLELDAHRVTMGFADYAEQVLAGRGDLYMVANNPFFTTPAGAPALAELGVDARYLSPDPSRTFMWFGPQGTVTHLHYDTVSVLFRQIWGRKRWTLIAPGERGRMYNRIGVYSDVDVTAPDLAEHPLFGNVTRADFDLEPGQSLLVPKGWWHAVQGLSPAISVSFTAFVWPNAPLTVTSGIDLGSTQTSNPALVYLQQR